MRRSRSLFVAVLLATWAAAEGRGDAADRLELAGGAGPGAGKHVVLLSGDEEYRSEEGLPMLARILSERHGFRCTVLFAIDPETGAIDPKNAKSLPGSEALESADAIVMLLRFRAWPDEAMKRFVAAYEAGKPIIALRTSTHAFQFPAGSQFSAYNDFGKNVLGERWVNHWGRHKSEATRGVVEPGAEGEPILRGVSEVFGDTDVYEAYPPADAKVLLRGAVLAGMTPDSPPASYRKKRTTDGVEQGINDPMMPVAWTREPTNAAGTTNRIFCTTMGSATDLQSEGLRRLVINAVYWGLNMEVPQEADARIVGEFEPSAYGFDGFRPGVKPAGLAPEEGATPDAAQGSALPLNFAPHERIALVGNSLGERMNLFGSFEAILHFRFPNHELVVRNFCRPADEVGNRQRSSNYTAIDDPLHEFGAQTFLCFFGFNESFAGTAGEEQFRAQYNAYLDELARQYPADASGAAPRFVLASPIAWEPDLDPMWPDADERNASLRRYAQIVGEIAAERGLAFVDLFSPTEQLFADVLGTDFTIDGCHLNEEGDRAVASLLDRALLGSEGPPSVTMDQFERLRSAVVDKAWVHQQDYRMLNGWYVYGGRRTWDTETFPREYKKIRAMAAVRDRIVWDLAQGKNPGPPDDSRTGELVVPPTRFGNPEQDYSEPEELHYLTPEESIAAMRVPDGFQVELFASEQEFPELAKPVQLNFDNRGRLWAACMPTYPQWKPGDPKPNDRLLIFEDADGDGRADLCKTFYDKLQNPTGFEFFAGGVLVVDQPRLIWLRDTDDDDRADVVVQVLDGWATDDTHHVVGAFEYSHSGLLHMLEGIAMSTAVETPWGPVRVQGPSGAYVFDPRTLKLRHFITPGHGNPWCYVFDEWGQGIVGDGTGAQQHWDSPLSGALSPERRGMDPIFNNQGMRPAVGSEFLVTRQFPDEVQGQFIYACVINMNGLPRFAVRDESAGFAGERVMQKSGGPDDLLVSSDKAFRPVDPQIGPDGALWFGDWCNALIGHMQYSQRDPNRDHQRGRIYRLVNVERSLLTPVTQHGKTEEELLDQLREYEPRTRYRARRELRDRETRAVVAATKAWAAGLDAADPQFDRLRCEALWVLAGHHAVDAEVLHAVLTSKTPQARAAAMHVAADERDYLPQAFDVLQAGVRDEHPRVRLEAIRGLSFFPALEATQAALAALESPMDSWVEYTLEHALGSLEPAWRDAYAAGTFPARDSAAHQFVSRYIERRSPGLAAQAHLKALLDPETSVDARSDAYAKLEHFDGQRNNGQRVFQRVCATCHRVGNTGYQFGPDLSDVGNRLKRREIIESIIEPSKRVDPKYVTTECLTVDGLTITGLVVLKDAKSLTVQQADGKVKKIPLEDIEVQSETNQSSMPENLAGTMAPAEFLDVIAFLSSLK